MKLSELLEAHVLGQGMSKAARAADVEQSDREYIAQRQRRQQAHQPTATEKHVTKFGLEMGRAGKPPLSRSSVEKSFGGYYDEYLRAYNKGKAEFDATDDHEAWREKRQAALQGRNYHE